MSVEVYMPKFGMTMKEGTIIEWIKKEGDFADKGEPLAEVESEKITNSVIAPAAGVVTKHLFSQGETVKIGTVIAYISSGETTEASIVQKELCPVSPAEEGTKIVLNRLPYTGIRKTIGDRMSESLMKSPQGTMTLKVDISGLLAFKEMCGNKKEKVSVTDILIKITGLVLEKNPMFNASIEGNEIVLYKSINIGVAVAGENGLMVPVIHGVQTKGLFKISAEMKELASKARENRITNEDMLGGTFTISNMGMFEVDLITPIINPPEVAILAVGGMRKETVVLENEMSEIRPMINLCLTVDHRVIDGVPAVKFLKDMNEIINNPEKYIPIKE